MYDERKERFSFKSFFLTLLLVVLFILLMLFLFPTRWDYKKASTVDVTYDLDRLSILYDEIFASNVDRMKDAAIGYFTNERMPKTVGQSKKLTLQEMYDLHLVLKMKDKDGKECSTTKSYVEMTKFTEEYRLKVNLSCGEQEDYIIVYLGCYSYCPSGVCEKQVSKPSETTKKEEQKYDEEGKYTCKVVNGKYYDKNGKVVSKLEYEKSCGTNDEKYVCKVVNGKYYDKNGKAVSESEYKKSCGISDEKYVCKVVNGKYYDKNGKAVSESEYKKSCGINDEKYVCKVVNGKYYDKNGKAVSESEYKKSCGINDEKYVCKVVNGKYYDKNGKAVSESEYKKSCGISDEKYVCKVVNGKYYDKNGKAVSESEYKKSCGINDEKYVCKVVNGKYYDKNGKAVSKSEYKKSCGINDEKYVCKVVNGKYYDKNGKAVSKSEYEKSCGIATEYTCKYVLVVEENVKYTDWSSWNKKIVNPTEKVEVQTKVVQEQIGTKTEKVKVGVNKQTVTKQVVEKYIEKYTTELVVVGTKQVQVGTTNKTTTKKVQTGTVEKYVGIDKGTVVPKDTSTRKYKVVSVNTSNTCSDCKNETIYTWEVYSIEPVYETKTVVEKVPVYKTVNVYEERQVPVYGHRVVEKQEVVETPVYKEVKSPIYGDVKYYRYRTKIVTPGYTDEKWSHKSDSSLLTKGYKMTLCKEV